MRWIGISAHLCRGVSTKQFNDVKVKGHGNIRTETCGVSREAMDTSRPPQRTKTLVPQNLACPEDEDDPVSVDAPPVTCPPSSRWAISSDLDDVYDAVSKGASHPTIPVEGGDQEHDAALFSLIGQALLDSDVFSYEATPTEEGIERSASESSESLRWSEPPEEAPPTQREAGAVASEDEGEVESSPRAWRPETWDVLVAKAREQRHEESRPATDVEPTHVRVQRLIEEGFSQLRDGNLEAAWEPWVEAHRLDPENRACRANIRRLAEKLGRNPPSHDD